MKSFIVLLFTATAFSTTITNFNFEFEGVSHNCRNVHHTKNGWEIYNSTNFNSTYSPSKEIQGCKLVDVEGDNFDRFYNYDCKDNFTNMYCASKSMETKFGLTCLGLRRYDVQPGTIKC